MLARLLLPLLPALVAAGLAGCGADSAAREAKRLREEVDRLLPPAVEIVEQHEGACVQLPGNPTCVRTYFRSTTRLPEARRAAALEQAAGRAGWEVVRREETAAGTVLELADDDFRAFAAVLSPEGVERCRAERRDEPCTDELQVVEG